MSDDPFTKYPSKLKDIKKRDFLVKQLKREREELHYERQRQLQLEQDEEPEEVVPIRGARAIVIVKDSYLSRNLSSFNHSVEKDSLPKKWSKKQHEEEQRLKEEEEDEDDDEDYEDEDYDDEDDELDDDDEEVDSNVAKLKIDKPVLAPSQSQKKLPTHEESDDDDEDELRLTQKKVVQFIEAFNEVEIIDCELNPNAKDVDDYNEAKTIAPQRMIRDKSKSPGLHAKTTPKLTPKSTHKDSDDTTVPSLDLGKNASTKSPYMKPTENDKKHKDLLQQMEDLDLASLTKPKSQDELSILPHPDELDTGVWWKYILDHGAIITKDGKFDIRVVDFFPPAKQHDIPESYFHLPPGRKSAPEKPLTAFGLFKKHQIAENPELIKQTNHSKKNRSKHSASDAQLKDMFHALPEDDILDYLALALCEKLRYKCQRAEYIYSQSTHMSQSKKERSTHKR